MVEKQYLCGSQYTGGNNKLTENILCYRGSAGSDNVEIALRQAQDSRGGLRGEDPYRSRLQVWGRDAFLAPDSSLLHSCGLRLAPYR
jgi:hypothetical protein